MPCRLCVRRTSVPPSVSGTPCWSLRRPGEWLKLLAAVLSWTDEAVSLDQPGGVVCFAEREQRLPQFLDGVEGLHPQKVLLQRADEALGAAIALGCANEGRGAVNAEEGKLLLEVVRHVLRAMVVPQLQAACDGDLPPSDSVKPLWPWWRIARPAAAS